MTKRFAFFTIMLSVFLVACSPQANFLKGVELLTSMSPDIQCPDKKVVVSDYSRNSTSNEASWVARCESTGKSYSCTGAYMSHSRGGSVALTGCQPLA
jgi:hypothetical protein